MRSIVAAVLMTASLLLASVIPARGQGMSGQQADAILKELQGIRHALERLATAPTARAPVLPPAPAAAPVVRMPVVTGHVLGRPTAPLTMVEFTDLQCPFCKRFHDTAFQRLKTEYIDKGLLRFVTRDFPLEMHAHANLAARASWCAGEQGHFWDLRGTLLAGSSTLTPESIDATARAADIDMKAFRACLESGDARERVQQGVAEGRALGVEGTPTFIVGRTAGAGVEGVRLVGAMPFETLDVRLKELLHENEAKR